MAPIPDQYTKHGFTFTLIARRGMVAIYEQAKAGRVWAYEAVRIRRQRAKESMGVSWPAREFLPSDAEWGVYGKTYSVSGTTGVAARKAAEAQVGIWAAPATPVA